MNQTTRNRFRRDGFVCLLLTVATIAAYFQMGGHDFINYDDPLYVTENPRVQAGLTWDGIVWAFRTGHASNWHPVTWLSHMIDVEIFGLNPGAHHMVNLFFHVLNALTLFFVLKRMTGAHWQPAVVSMLFAIHPLHVESVAWVAERKDVLSTFFGFLALWAYAGFVEKKRHGHYGALLLSFALSLMAKPMLVTLPFLLLLLDYWPLGRIRTQNGAGHTLTRDMVVHAKEKWPLFFLAGASCVVTFLVQQHGPAVQSLEQIPLGVRVTNAVVAYAAYVVKAFWPSHLAVYYPHPMDGLPLWLVGGSLLLLFVATTFFMARRREYPFGIVGWLWFLGTLVPVIGMVQVGGQAMADRYTYFPMMGIFIAAVWGISVFVEKKRAWRNAVVVGASVVITLLGITTWKQVGYWKDSVTLFKHALAVTAKNQLAHNQLGFALNKEEKFEEAIVQLREALRITPQYVGAHINLGNALKEKGELDAAANEYRDALRYDPRHVTAMNNLGILLAMQGKESDGLAQFSRVLDIDPENARAHNNLGIIYIKRGEKTKAIHHFQEALRFDPSSVSAQRNLNRAMESP